MRVGHVLAAFHGACVSMHTHTQVEDEKVQRTGAMRRVAQMQADMHDVMGAGRTLMHLSELYHDRYADPNGQHDALDQALLECLHPSFLCI